MWYLSSLYYVDTSRWLTSLLLVYGRVKKKEEKESTVFLGRSAAPKQSRQSRHNFGLEGSVKFISLPKVVLQIGLISTWSQKDKNNRRGISVAKTNHFT